MINWHKVPFVRLLIPLIIGIISAQWYVFDLYLSGSLIVFLFLLLIVFKFIKKRFTSSVFGSLLFLLIFFVANILVHVNNEHSSRYHYSQYLNEQKNIIAGRIEDMPVERETTIKIKLSIWQVNDNEKTTGTILVYMQKSPEALRLKYGDLLVLVGEIQEIASPLNPQEFNYKKYLNVKNIYHQAYIRNNDWQYIANKPANRFLEKVYQSRAALLGTLQKAIKHTNERAIANALLVGYKAELNSELQKQYANAGAMHVLAVSGLHVGIIYVIFSSMLFFMKQKRWLIWLKVLLIIVFLWFYALLTGMSPSVMRAATMFSFIALAQGFNRYKNIYNTIAASAFVLIVFNPFVLFEVGFQLSYLAVLGIIFLQPKIYNLIACRHIVFDKIWALTAVSIAAQLATFPIGLYYFNQFPNYFWLTNLVVIPAASIIIYTGIGVVLFSFIPIIGNFVSQILEYELYGLNKAVGYIDALPYATIQNVNISQSQMFFLYILILSIVFFIINKQFKTLLIAGFSSIIILIISIWHAYNTSNQNLFCVYNISNHSAIDIIYGQSNLLLTDYPLIYEKSKIKYHVKPFWLHQSIKNNHISAISDMEYRQKYDDKPFHFYKNIIAIKNIKAAIVSDKLKPIYPQKRIAVDFLILRNNPRLKIKELLKIYNPKLIITDASNYDWQIKKWKEIIEASNIKFYNTKKDGAFIFKL